MPLPDFGCEASNFWVLGADKTVPGAWGDAATAWKFGQLTRRYRCGHPGARLRRALPRSRRGGPDRVPGLLCAAAGGLKGCGRGRSPTSSSLWRVRPR